MTVVVLERELPGVHGDDVCRSPAAPVRAFRPRWPPATWSWTVAGDAGEAALRVVNSGPPVPPSVRAADCALMPGLGERAAGQERPQRAGVAAHAQRAVGADLQPGPDDDVDGPVLTAGDPADRPLHVAGDIERAPQQS